MTLLDPRLHSFYEVELPLVYDASALVHLMSCPRKFLFSKINRLRTPGSNIHLVAGGTFAAGLETYRKEIFLNDADHETAMAAALLAAFEAWGTFPHEIANKTTKPLTSVLMALESYIRHYPPRTDVLRPHIQTYSGRPSVEFSFALPLDHSGFPAHPVTGDPFILAGRFDMLAYHTTMQRDKWVDEKTTYSLGASFAEKWKLRFQFLTYTWALNRLGYAVDGGIVRGVGMLKGRTDFLEIPVTVQPHVLREYEQSLHYLFSLLVSSYRRGYFPPYYGEHCDRCMFNPLCSNRHADNWKSLYELDTWDPLRGTDDEG